MGRKHCGKRRNCSLQAISIFPSVFKWFAMQTPKNQGLFRKGLTLPKRQILDSSKLKYLVCRQKFQKWKWKKALEMGRKRCWKRRNYSLWTISSFPSVFKRLVLHTHENKACLGNCKPPSFLPFHGLSSPLQSRESQGLSHVNPLPNNHAF